MKGIQKNVRLVALLAFLLLLNIVVINIEQADAQPNKPPRVGPRYYANVQIWNGADQLPPGVGAITKKVWVDTGSPFTIVNRSNAAALGLLDPTGPPPNPPFSPVPGLLGGLTQIGGVGGRRFWVCYSINLTIRAQGKHSDCTDKDTEFKARGPYCKQILYPFPGGPDLPELLGTNFIEELGEEPNPTSMTVQSKPKDGVSFFDKIPKPDEGKKVPVKPAPKTPVPGGHKLKYIEDVKVNGFFLGDFYVVTGSPYTIIGNSLASSLGLSPIDYFDIYNLDNQTFTRLFWDEFFNATNPGPLPVLRLDSVAIQTLLGDYIEFSEVEVLVNPFSDDNILGTNLLKVGDFDTKIDFTNDLIVYGTTSVGNSWVGGAPEQFGPRLDRVVIKMYSNLDAVFTALEVGGIDIADAPLPNAWVDKWSSAPYNESIALSWYGNGWKAYRRYYSGGTAGTPVFPDDGENQYRGNLWVGIVNQTYFGVDSWGSFLNAHTNTSDFGDGQHMTIRYGWSKQGCPLSLNPLYSTSYLDWQILGTIYDTLGKRDPYDQSKWNPYLILNWTVGTWQDGALTKSKVKITLRPDIKYSDGSLLTVDDVIYSLTELPKALTNGGYPSSWLRPSESVQSAEVLDPISVEILYSWLNSSLAEDLTLSGFIFPKHIWKPIIDSGDPEAFAPDPNLIGSGPWRYVSRTPDVSVLMVANRPGSIVTTDLPGAEPVTSPGAFNYYPVDIQAYANDYKAKFLPESDVNIKIKLHNMWTNHPIEVDKYVTIKRINPVGPLNGTLAQITVFASGLMLNPSVPDVESFTVENILAGRVQINVTILYQTSPFVDLKGTVIVDLWITFREDIGGAFMGTPGFPIPDMKIDGKDIAILARAFGTKPGDTRWSTVGDITGDYKIDGKDIARITKRFGWHA